MLAWSDHRAETGQAIEEPDIGSRADGLPCLEGGRTSPAETPDIAGSAIAPQAYLISLYQNIRVFG
jgi:hypothetical protein